MATAALDGAYLPLHGDAAAKLAEQFEELAKAQEAAFQARLAALQAQVAAPYGGRAGGGQGLKRGNEGKDCWDWGIGACKRGDNCRFMHDRSKRGRPEELGACKQFMRTGACSRGSKFAFTHEEK